MPGESKPDTRHRIRVEANGKYAVSAYRDSCGRGYKAKQGTNSPFKQENVSLLTCPQQKLNKRKP